MRILKLSFIFIMLFGLLSCSKENGEYRRFEFYTYMIVEETGEGIDSLLLNKYQNTYYDIYEKTLHYYNGKEVKAYNYKFNEGNIEVQGLKNMAITFKGNQLQIDVKVTNGKVRLIYNLTK